MNILIYKTPHHVEIDGVKYSINHDFRTSMQFELLIQESDLPKEEKVLQALRLYYDVIPKNLAKAIDKMLWFYSCGKEIKTNSQNSEKQEDFSLNFAKRLYSFNHDRNYIFSAFYQQYGIDLVKKNLHWWKFKALFDSITDDCLFGKILYYRGVEVNSDMSKSQQQRIRRLKEIYALPLTENEQKQLEEFENALINGDLSQFEL